MDGNPTIPPFMSNFYYIVIVSCLCVLLIFSLIIIFVICCRQRRKISKLEQKLVEAEKNDESTEQKIPIEGKEIIINRGSPASQVWESDECVFYDLGSISRGNSKEILDQIEEANGEPPFNNTENKKSSSNDEHETLCLEETRTKSEYIEKDINIHENGSVKSIQDCKVSSGSLEELTDGIWVGDTKKESNEKLKFIDALSDVSETGALEDSGNETISTDDMLCPIVEGTAEGKEEEIEDKIEEERSEEIVEELAEEENNVSGEGEAVKEPEDED